MPTTPYYNCFIVGVLCLYNITWRGLAAVAYPCMGAMRRPELRDGREVETPMPFLFPKLYRFINAEFGEFIGNFKY